MTSESVTEGHPDKLCDQISDAILDEALKSDPNSRVACECCTKTGFVMLFGEITTKSDINYEKIARDVISDIGYNSSEDCFDSKTCAVVLSISEQSKDISMGVDNSLEKKELKKTYEDFGAGDQGMMFGYATNETESLMPLPLDLAHKLTFQLTKVRKNKILSYLKPDGKSQVTVEYDTVTNKPKRVDTIVISAQHAEKVDILKLREDIRKEVINKVIDKNMIDKNTKIYINPTGRFVIGGPKGDSGLTGRKIIVDTYGGFCTHGGGAFSGKDPTKVDRSAAYYARYVAKNIVKAELADKCKISLAYAIGVANPVSIDIDTYGTSKVSDELIIRAVEKVFDFRPSAIIDLLDLRKPIYRKTTNYGHFGRNGFTWEQTDKVEDIKKALKELTK